MMIGNKKWYCILTICLLSQIVLFVNNTESVDSWFKKLCKMGSSSETQASSSNSADIMGSSGDEIKLLSKFDGINFLRDCVDQAMLIEMPPIALKSGLTKFMRIKMNLLFVSSETVPKYEEFEEKFKTEVVEPCKQLQSILGEYWHQVVNEGKSDRRLGDSWLVVENVCRNIIADRESVEPLITNVYEDFGRQLISDFRCQSTDHSDWFVNEAHWTLERLLGHNDYQRTIYRLGRVDLVIDPVDQGKNLHQTIPRYALVRAIEFVIRYEMWPGIEKQGVPTKESFEKEFKTKVAAPCKPVQALLGNWWEINHMRDLWLEDRILLQAALVCQNVIADKENLKDEAYGEFEKQFKSRPLTSIGAFSGLNDDWRAILP